MMARTAALLLGSLGAVAAFGLGDVAVSPLPSEEPVVGPVVAAVLEVIDGDTIMVRARIWLGQDVETRVRLSGADAPESKGRCEEERRLARAARDFVRDRVASGRVSLRDIRYDKYGRRVLARVITPEGEDLAESLIRHGLARPYGGGARAGWCSDKGT
ncbi:MAG: thermonuclease family protein [Rhodospirillales bacterium]|nr:thermonuclease family protein [Rhodospirillales bacterium]